MATDPKDDAAPKNVKDQLREADQLLAQMESLATKARLILQKAKESAEHG